MENINIRSFVASSRLLLHVWRLLFTDQIIKTLNVSVDQMTRPNICFKTCGRAFERFMRAFETLSRAFEGLRENQKLGLEFEKLGRVFEKLARMFVL